MEYILKIHGSVIPIVVASRFTSDTNSDRTIKRQTIHDASFSSPSELLINKKMHRELFANYYCIHCSICIFHAIHIMRLIRLGIQTLISKLYLDTAYHRQHILAVMVVMIVTIIQILRIYYSA